MKRTAVSNSTTITPVTRKPSRAAALPPKPRPAPPVPLDAFESMPEHELAVIAAARSILRARLKCGEGTALTCPAATRDLARLHLGGHGHEVFAVIFLDAQNRFIALEEMFRGTLTQTAVYPREVARAALRHNAASVILAHNHPSGCTEPSRADGFLTETLKSTLAMIDVRVLDHLVVGGDRVASFAELGLM